MGKEISVINKEDASSVGAAILGLQATGLIGKEVPHHFFKVQQQYKPDLKLHACYQQYYAVYATLYNKLQDDFHTLNAIQESMDKQRQVLSS